MTQRTIKYGIAFDVDKISLQNVQKQLRDIMNTPSSGMEQGFERTRETATQLYNIIRQCYNQDLGTLNVQKFNTMLKQSKLTLQDMRSVAPTTFNKMGMAISSANVQLTKNNGLLMNIAKTLTDSLKWSVAYGLINKVSQSLSDAVGYVKDLDTSLNDIRIVTGKSAEDMNKFAREANKAAVALGSSTKAYADASLIYYQQGLGDTEAKERARITTMVANVTGQSAAAASEQLTAIWNGYKVNAAEAELYIDKVAKVAAQTGADLEELSTGMSKVASAANIMGVDIDELNAQLATVITVTRQAPESVGTAFKTIYARINAIESGSEDAETTLKSYTKTMLEYGVNVLDMNGKLRDTGDVIAEIGGKWGTMTKEQQLGLAQAMAGQRQYNNLLALFDNWDMYNDALHESQTAMGTLQEQQDIYSESVAAAANKSKAQFESLYSSILTSDSLTGFYDFTGNIAATFEKIFGSFGGGLKSLVPVLLSIASLFSRQIANGAAGLVNNLSKARAEADLVQQQLELVAAGAQRAKNNPNQGVYMLDKSWQQGYQKQLDYLEQMYAKRMGLDEVAQQEIVKGAARIGQLEQELSLETMLMEKRRNDINAEGADYKRADLLHSFNPLQGLDVKQISQGRMRGITEDDLSKRIAGNEQILSIEQQIVQVQQQQVANGGQKLKYSRILSTEQKQIINNALKENGIEVAYNMSYEDRIRLIEQATNKQRQFSKEVDESSGKVAESALEYDLLDQQIQESINSSSKLAAVTKGITGTLSAVGTAAMGWSMLKTSIDATKEALEGTTSWGDAITQILIGASMSIPMILGAIKNFNAVFGITTGLMDGFRAAQTLSTATGTKWFAMIGKKISATSILNGLQITENGIQDAANKNDAKELALEYSLLQTDEQKLRMLSQLSAAELASLGLDKAQIESLKKQTAAQLKFNTSAWANPYLLIGALVIAAIAGITAALIIMAKNQESASEKAKKRLENEKKATEELGQVTKSLKDNVANIATEFEKYEKAVTMLKACTKGTSEWNEALTQVNNSVQALKDAYPALKEMAGVFIWNDELGTYVIDAGKLNEVQQSQKDSETASAWATLNSQEDAAEKAVDLRLKEAAESLSFTYKNVNSAKSHGLAAASETYHLTETDIAEFMALPDQSYENILEHLAALAEQRQEESVKNYIESIGGRDYNFDPETRTYSWKTSNGSTDTFTSSDWSTLLSDEAQKIVEQLEQLNSLQQQAVNIADNTRKQWIAENTDLLQDAASRENISEEQYQAFTHTVYAFNDNFQDSLEEALRQMFDKGYNSLSEEQSQILDKYFKITGNESWIKEENQQSKKQQGFHKDDKTGGDWLKQLLALQGGNQDTWVYKLSDSTTEKNWIRGDDNNRTFYLNVNGTDKEVSSDTLYGYLAAQKALENLGATAQAAASALGKIESNSYGASNALYSLLTDGNIDNVSAEDAKDIRAALKVDGLNFVKNMGLTEEELRYFGATGDTLEELQQSYFNILQKAYGDFQEYAATEQGKAVSDLYKKTFGDDLLDDTFSTAQAKKVGSAFSNILIANGVDAGEKLIKSVFGEETADDVATVAINFDFASGTLEDFSAAVKAVNNAAEPEAIEALYYAMRKANNETRMATDSLAKAAKITRGSTLTVKEYANYADYAADYFTKMHDGTYMLTKDAETFYNLVKSKYQGQLKDSIAEQKNVISNLERSYATVQRGQSTWDEEDVKLIAQTLFDTGKIGQEEYLDILGDPASEESKDQIANWWETLIPDAEAYNKLLTKQKDILNDNQEALATTAETQVELNELMIEGHLEAEDAQAGMDALRAQQISKYGTPEEAKAYVELRKQELNLTELTAEEQKYYNDLLEDEYVAQKKLQKAFDDIHESFPEYKQTILDPNASEVEKAEAVSKLQTALKDGLGLEVDASFFYGEEGQKNLALYEQAINGSATALKKLKVLAQKDIVDTNPLFQGLKEDGKKAVNAFIDWVAENPVKIGEEVKYDQLIEVFKYLVEQAGLSAAQIEGFFKGLNLTPNFKTQTFLNRNDAEQAAKYYKDKGYFVTNPVGQDGSFWTLSYSKALLGTGGGNPYTRGGDKGKDPNWATEEDKVDLARASQKEHWEHYAEQLKAATKELKAMEKQLSVLAKKSEHLVGQDKIDNLNDQIKLIKKQNAALEKQNERLKERAVLEAKYLRLQYEQYGLIVDENTGELKNYSQVYQTLFNIMITAQKKLNDAIDRGIDKSTEDFKILKAAADEAAEALSKFTSATSAFEEIFSQIEDNNATITENLDEIIDKQIEAFNAKIEVEIDLHDFDQKMREFERTMNFKEGAFGSIVGIAQSKLEELGAMIGDGGILQKLTDHVNNLKNSQGTYGDHTKDYLDDLKEYATELIDNLEDAEELIDDIREAMVELMEEASEAFDTQISRYEALQATLEHDIKLLGLLDGEENNYAAKQAFYDKQNENYISQLAFQKEQVAFWQKQVEMAEEGSEAYETAEENMREAIESSQETLEKAIESAQAAHINSIRAIFEELENQITGGKGLDQLTKEWELIRENADYYLDDVNEAYELSKLERNYRKAIDESDSAYAQRQINDMMSSELAMLKEKDKLTKYDIDRANLKYQLTLKQIALEDAQKNKSTMRLKRDKNGNYSYQYVADSSATSQLEQEIADLNNQIHNLDKEAYSSNLEQIKQVYQEWTEAMIEIENSGGTEEEKAEKRLAINKLYTERLQQLMTENQWMLTNLEQATIDSITGTWGNGVQQMVDAIQAEGGLEPVMNRVMSQITEATIAYQNTVTSMCEAAGKSLDDLYSGFDQNIDILGDLITKNDDVIAKYDEELGRMQTVLDTLEDMLIKYGEVRQAAIDAANAAYAQYQAVAHAALQGTTGNNSTYSDDTDWAWEMAKEFVKGNIWTDEATHRQTKITNNDGKDYGVDNPRLIRLFNAAAEGDEAAINLINEVAQRKKYFTHETLDAIGFNTGGYTGAWANGDNDGRLAFLHQKELVLNRADTANLLKAIDVVRSLDMSLMSRMAGMLGQIGLRSLGAHTPESAPIEQNVHIDAHFPNVSSAQEIQEAFDQLADQLGQILYQNRK